ncbi:bifunctional tRNA (5-methylaminomethyl-2-thiouridine)(34)-methyltransferase MnmD/FAD-dependent 5-carboxymethylaminomethyl-2-thiouridine(34) oxidoreductase MnmC [Emcibacter sp.]|uniref:bifunctional tRNA (5-methylaminomethyl-2-thiouridine)(34)-methyltransferase MnmD/FAD-dependent 5-carboxymethylaminomethyl-2-thiouridine(34) oxidoreductase MnmC n=1 Tax=Emcibacter sp. TaxID=1979954 RepID=UPI002AA85155|nr:bifunctional tRNA (5-methylaminomethyl-2-thiouridine)(34)-methyltransferase MnmD/FAD-dependent 5-carboxymethylaminomethyl-2-thiouridine(34) oxidoreductase MnmC [Emcibacter sp.]
MSPDDLYWQEDGTPASRRFNDIYYSPENGLEESRHVFLEGTGAPGIWKNRNQFSIGETGFGTGLNFLLSVREWRATAPKGAHLFYLSVEKYPLAPNDIRKAISRWPELSRELDELLDIYPEPIEGFHQRSLFDGRVTLLLLFGDAADMLSRCARRPLDAWYLDGFAPRRNADMWKDELFEQLARLSAPGTRIATFTAAGFVRRGLEQAGFALQKTPGFGRKRECLKGQFTDAAVTSKPVRDEPWYRLPAALPRNNHIAILGAGIAGMMTGWHLSRAGYRVTVIDRRDAPMQETSGNPAAILDPFLSIDDGREGRFHRHALLYALKFYHDLPDGIFHACGLERRASSAREQDRFDRIMETTPLPDHILQQREDGSLYFPSLGYLLPEKLCEFLRQDLDFRGGVQVEKIEQREDKWHFPDAAGDSLQAADAVILTAPSLIRKLSQTSHLPLDALSGQISWFRTPASTPDHIVTEEGYVIPPLDLNGEKVTIAGASFQPVDDPDSILPLTGREHKENRERAAVLLPELGQADLLGGRSAIRWFSPNHLPYAGPVPDADFYLQEYEPLRHGPRHRPLPGARYHPNIFMLSALGARGFLTSPLLAQHLASLIIGTVPPLEQYITNALHPGRFLIRKLVKGR